MEFEVCLVNIQAYCTCKHCEYLSFITEQDWYMDPDLIDYYRSIGHPAYF